jgi:hypothetical protein
MNGAWLWFVQKLGMAKPDHGASLVDCYDQVIPLGHASASVTTARANSLGFDQRRGRRAPIEILNSTSSSHRRISVSWSLLRAVLSVTDRYAILTSSAPADYETATGRG